MIIKMMLMSPLTEFYRYKNKTFASVEDTTAYTGVTPKFDDPEVERIRRAHRNDLENVMTFISVGFFFMLTSPSTFVAVNLYRIAGIGRIAHTIFYAIYPMQPHRNVSWYATYGATFFMALGVLFPSM